jgi:serine/threonine-protein kinase ATR
MTASHHKKRAYTLLSPYLDRIAPYLVARIKTHPASLVETCAFMSTPVPAFIAVTLNFTLPPLFADREREILDALAREVGKKVYELFFSHASKILAHIFMLSKPGKTTAAINFIVELLTTATDTHGTNDVSAQSVVRTQIVDVISEIVMKMGGDDPIAIQLVNFTHFMMALADAVVGEAVSAQASASCGEQALSVRFYRRCG